MSAERRQATNSQFWTQWESQVVNGVFPLRRFLGGSDRGAVFLSEYKAGKLPDVAIKLVRADALQADAQLARWRRAATLSHPHLIQLFDAGRCRLGKREFLFVIMEYAEQTLAQVLSRRALSSDEVPEMLLPALDALAFLHRNQLVHGRVKPSNFMSVNDRLKLASDTVGPTGKFRSGSAGNSSYDPPELKGSGMSTAGDVWSLGVTLVEALTQRTPAWSDERRKTVSLPATFPAPFANTVQRCLNLAPASRPTVIELKTQYKLARQRRSASDSEPPAHESPRDTATSRNSPKRHRLALAIAAGLLVLLAVQVGLHFSGTWQADLQPTAVPTLAPADPLTNMTPAESNSTLSGPASRLPGRPSPPAATSPSVLLEVSPDVPQAIRDKMQGQVVVTVRVLVDPSGNVIGALAENSGPTQNFVRLADEAAREWKFVPADDQPTRVWLLSFTFDRDGVTADATAVQ